MVYGNQATVTSINQALSSTAIQLRDTLQVIANLQAYVSSIGAAGLEALPPGGAPAAYSAADAAAIIALVGNWATYAQIGNGIAVGMALPFNFVADGEPTWAGQ